MLWPKVSKLFSHEAPGLGASAAAAASTPSKRQHVGGENPEAAAGGAAAAPASSTRRHRAVPPDGDAGPRSWAAILAAWDTVQLPNQRDRSPPRGGDYLLVFTVFLP